MSGALRALKRRQRMRIPMFLFDVTQCSKNQFRARLNPV
jgi:hypothetical protein